MTVALLAAGAAVAASVAISCPHDNVNMYGVMVYQVDSGWGYDIDFGGRTVIHQPFIPALSGNMPFPDKASASAAGRLVVKKLVAGDSPSLDEDEVNGLLGAGTPKRLEKLCK